MSAELALVRQESTAEALPELSFVGQLEVDIAALAKAVNEASPLEQSRYIAVMSRRTDEYLQCLGTRRS